ncbi:MAG: DUF4124 domain-containing protein [Gammaproteobacteria bacterium]
MPTRRAEGLLLGVVALLCAAPTPAEFYRWTDAHGRVRVSNVPPRGVRADGSLAPGFNPLSIQAQHAALRARLAARDAELAAAAAAQSEAASAAREK